MKELEYLAKQAKYALIAPSPKQAISAKPETILAIAEAFRSLEQEKEAAESALERESDIHIDTAASMREWRLRAETAEAKLAERENNSLIDHLEKCSAIVASWPEWKKQGADASKFTRPAPKNVSYLVAPGEPSSLWAMGFSACIDTILRNIDEENKK